MVGTHVNVEEGIAVGDERHLSNWFAVTLPEHIHIHKLRGLSGQGRTFPFPTAAYRNGLLTFALDGDVATQLVSPAPPLGCKPMLACPHWVPFPETSDDVSKTIVQSRQCSFPRFARKLRPPVHREAPPLASLGASGSKSCRARAG